MEVQGQHRPKKKKKSYQDTISNNNLGIVYTSIILVMMEMKVENCGPRLALEKTKGVSEKVD
jgi:hypothetical protein